MKTQLFTFFLTLTLAAAMTLEISATVKAQGVTVGEDRVVTAEVVGLDRVDRTVTLLGPEGNVVEIEVSHAARNFDQLEIGDQVRGEYYESVALYLGKHGQKPEASEGLVAARSAKGDKPGGVVVEAALDGPNQVYAWRSADQYQGCTYLNTRRPGEIYIVPVFGWTKRRARWRWRSSWTTTPTPSSP